jgi:hypothetical protein
VKRLLLVAIALAILPAASPRPEGAGRGPQMPASQDAPPPPQRATCVFTNASFSGKCVETADVPSGGSAQQACESILRCLNDPGCVKTYCQATTIRSGWRLESATAK